MVFLGKAIASLSVPGSNTEGGIIEVGGNQGAHRQGAHRPMRLHLILN